MQKVAIIGTSGSGKTTLGKALAHKMGAVAVDLDELSWEPGWQIVPDEEFDQRLSLALQTECWVTSGNYSRVQHRYLALADTVIWLDYPFRVVLYRVLIRTFRRNFFHERCCNGNYESLRRTLSRESIILWVFQTYKGRREKSLKLFASDEYPHLNKLSFRSPREAKKWLDSLSN